MLIRLASLLLCAATAVAAGTGYLFAAAALYVLAGVLEFFSKYDSAKRALFGSVSDRWGELAVFTGYAWFTHDSPWLLAVMGAATGSMMVSYTRARAEGLGVATGGDAMLGTERIVLVAAGTWIAAWFEEDAVLIVGITLAVYGVAAAITAIRRGIIAYHRLAEMAAQPAAAPATASTPTDDSTRTADA